MTEYGVNFRGTSAAPLTDGAHEAAQVGTSGTGGADIVAGSVGVVYPQPHPDGFDFGWESTSITGGDNIVVRTRATTGDIRTCGVHTLGSSEIADFRFDLDLDGAGEYAIRLAAGDRNYQVNSKIELFDDTSSLGVLFDGATGGNGRFFDATGTIHTSSANWVTNNTRENHTFSSSIARLRVGGSTATGSGAISHVSFEFVGGGGGGDRPKHLLLIGCGD